MLASIPVNQAQFDALFSWVYNRGFGAHNLASAIAELKAGNPRGAAGYIVGAGSFETVPNIVARRAREAALFLGGELAGEVAQAATSRTGLAVVALVGLTVLASRQGWI